MSTKHRGRRDETEQPGTLRCRVIGRVYATCSSRGLYARARAHNAYGSTAYNNNNNNNTMVRSSTSIVVNTCDRSPATAPRSGGGGSPRLEVTAIPPPDSPRRPTVEISGTGLGDAPPPPQPQPTHGPDP